MDRRLLLVAALVLVCTVGTLAVGPCEPDCDGKEGLDKVPDPYNCTNYYYCLDDGVPSDVPLPCPEGKIFDEAVGACVVGTDCDPTCVPVPCHLTCTDLGDTISDPYDCSIYQICGPGGVIVGTGSCPPDIPYFDGTNCVNDETKCCTDLCTPYCGPGVVQAPDPEDCTKFYMCLEEGPVDPALHYSCEGGEYFNIPAGRCLPGTDCEPLC